MWRQTWCRAEALPFALAGNNLINDRHAKSTSGLLIVYMARLRLAQPWSLTPLILKALLVLGGLLGSTPTFNR